MVMAVKHSGAKDAKIELTGSRDAIHLRIVDSGVGFDPKSINEKSLGLVSMEERSRLVQGVAQIAPLTGHQHRSQDSLGCARCLKMVRGELGLPSLSGPAAMLVKKDFYGRPDRAGALMSAFG